ncbi:LuxR C-terminal-related transcriptional regulator [Gilvimarinus sp. F26214L]|uniref:LuxR C-terminal-related transcriptional regulator n=1 Tax=Gilvimarinus sp. DZF01 TaxID=3461371 RepID=UPI0040463812
MTVESSSIASHLKPIAIFSSQAPNRLAESLTRSLARPCVTRSLGDDEVVEHRPLILIDCACYTPNRIQTWLNVKNAASVPPVALYNTQPASLHESLLEWPCVRGFFYCNMNQSQFVEGLKMLLDGDYWVPRRLLHGFLERNRRPPKHNIKAPELLTRREREILALLENGATNAAMARAMSVSEHTIKTHLYNIYKKIDVGNRVEAINWSRQNLTANLSI